MVCLNSFIVSNSDTLPALTCSSSSAALYHTASVAPESEGYSSSALAFSLPVVALVTCVLALVSR